MTRRGGQNFRNRLGQNFRNPHLWNGITAWPLLILHAFGALGQYPIYDIARDGGWYQFGFLIGAGSPFLGMLGRKKLRSRTPDCP